MNDTRHMELANLIRRFLQRETAGTAAATQVAMIVVATFAMDAASGNTHKAALLIEDLGRAAASDVRNDAIRPVANKEHPLQ